MVVNTKTTREVPVLSIYSCAMYDGSTPVKITGSKSNTQTQRRLYHSRCSSCNARNANSEMSSSGVEILLDTGFSTVASPASGFLHKPTTEASKAAEVTFSPREVFRDDLPNSCFANAQACGNIGSYQSFGQFGASNSAFEITLKAGYYPPPTSLPRPTFHIPMKGLSMRPKNLAQWTVNCCHGGNCNEVVNSAYESTPPYGSRMSDSFSKAGLEDCSLEQKKRFRAFSERARRTTCKRRERLKKETADKNTIKNSECDRSRQNALFIYNLLLRQMNENMHDEPHCVEARVSANNGCSTYFTPSVTSTPLHEKPPETTHTKTTSVNKFKKERGYSNAGSSLRTSFVKASHFNETRSGYGKFFDEKQENLRQDKLNRNRTKENESMFTTRSQQVRFRASCCSGRSLISNFARNERSPSISTTVASENERTKIELPGIYPIGAPRAASSPILRRKQNVKERSRGVDDVRRR